ncbi:MAG: porin [Gammaproteobacteria bacterium]|nr:porin [Gammaproteobacteria bacterium]CAJ2377692.1 MAG: exported hypothetical protein [Arenicellales bacterium IbO2]MDA7962577.1 porin [Gammaproteobacteria bacterium]MDA7970338.1 porin [Gammaproteobacteria bacterium]MDA7996243.1 porin [Gammaproteobacteria bacterium]
MNKKLIAAAVAATVAPVAAQAQVSVYGRINNAVDIKDIAGQKAMLPIDNSGAQGTAGTARTSAEREPDAGTTDVSGVASRFGVRYSGDIGGGMTALGRYEFATTTDKEGPGVNDTRIATVGLQGPFGTINIGNQWSAFFNTVGTHVSPTYSLGYYLYSSVAGMPFRASNTVKYSNNFGPMYVEIDARFDGTTDDGTENGGQSEQADAEKIHGDGFGIGISMPLANNLTLALAFDAEDGNAESTEDDEDRVGAALKWSGPVEFAVGYTNHTDENTANSYDDVDVTGIYVNAAGQINQQTRWFLSYATADTAVAVGDEVANLGTDGGARTAIADTDDILDDATQVVMGLYYTLGGGLRMYYEGTMLDGGPSRWDGMRHLLGMRVDF